MTEVVSTDRTQRGLYTRPSSRFFHIDRLSSVNKMFIIWQKKKNLIRLMKLVFTDDEPFLILPKFALLLYFFFVISFLALTEINIIR